MDIGPADDRGRQDVPIIGIGKLKRGDECLVPGNHGAGYRLVHHLRHRQQLITSKIDSLPEDRVDPFALDVCAPARAKEPTFGSFHAEAAQASSEKHVRVEEGGERGIHKSVEVQILRNLSHPVEELLVFGIALGTVFEQVGRTNTTVRTHFAERQLLTFKHRHQVGTRHVEQVGRLLRCQLRIVRNEGHGFLISHVRQNVNNETEGACRNWNDDVGKFNDAKAYVLISLGNGRQARDSLASDYGLFVARDERSSFHKCQHGPRPKGTCHRRRRTLETRRRRRGCG